MAISAAPISAAPISALPPVVPFLPRSVVPFFAAATWSLAQYQVPQNFVTPSVAAGAQIPIGPNQDAAQRRDQYWSPRDYWVRPPVVQPPVVVTATPYVAPPQLEREGWRADQYQVPQAVNTPAIAAGAQIPIGPNQDAAQRRDQYWSPRDYWTRPPVVQPTFGAITPRTPIAQLPWKDWSPRDYWTAPPVVQPTFGAITPRTPVSWLPWKPWDLSVYQPRVDRVQPTFGAITPYVPVAQLPWKDWSPRDYWTAPPVVQPTFGAVTPYAPPAQVNWKGWDPSNYQTQSLFVQPAATGVFQPYVAAPQITWRAIDPSNYQVQAPVTTPAGVTPPPPVTVTPPAAGGLLPGKLGPPRSELGKGMGPYKRPGQVFGEEYPRSPNTTSKAVQKAVKQAIAERQVPIIPPRDEIGDLIALLLAADELEARPGDLFRDPPTVYVFRKH